MLFKTDDISTTCPEPQVFEAMLDLDEKHILELGCGRADLTRLIANTGNGRQIVATEVDEIQHSLNLAIDDLPNVKFELAGAQSIPQADESFDRVLMFKSLHHVPMEQIDSALLEIKRVMKPGGLLYISEPLFQGEFNEVLALFHNEESIREQAFKAVNRAVESDILSLKQQQFFNAPVNIAEFSIFEKSIIGATHTEHKLDADLLARVRSKFETIVAINKGMFKMPMRVDLLQK